MNEPRPFEIRIKRLDLAAEVAQEIHFRHFGEVEQRGAQPVVDVMRIIGDVVGERRRLRLGAGVTCERQIVLGVIFA